jgi:histidyl-tRNA synthetase
MSETQEKFSGVKGMNDMLPVDGAYWERFELAARGIARAYGYSEVRTPIVEQTRLFKRSIGEVTDIVEKEMYSFTDALNGEELTLRPEGTAAVVRSVIEHNLLYNTPQRLWYMGPMFRHERPQRGRYRQFHQFGIEALGFAGPDVDVEIILVARRLFEDLGLENIRLEINSIGQPDERARHRAELISYFSAHAGLLDADAQRRLHSNPLRILDTKNPVMQAMVDGAPRLLEFLGPASLAHFEGFQALLKAVGVEYRINPRLVRGLDYYNLTVFEWVSDTLGAQGTVCGGGRYDPLIAMMGGRGAPACGFAMGIERIIDLMRQQAPLEPEPGCDVYLMHQGEDGARVALTVAEELRTVGLDAILHCSAEGRASSLKAQMKRADASGAAFGLIFGEEEVAAGEVSVKALRESASGGAQRRIRIERLVEHLIDEMAGSDDFE